MTRLELLAPAKTADIGITAVEYGADAVYIGARSHGARQAASNSTGEIGRLCDFAHKFNARVYVTLNTLIYENELKDVEKLIGELYRTGVDALIVQDLGILRLDIPPIALHASTQCDIRNVASAKLYEALGFSQLVLARELGLKEIKDIREAVKVPLEGFVHGALCVCYSGCCTAGLRLSGRSGNRGECPQVCRLPFTLTDNSGRKIAENRHVLSLKDMNRLEHLDQMAAAGISSFKIEGRLKEESYVKNVVTAYRRELDRIIEASGGVFGRSSDGISSGKFIPDLSKSFNRGYTDYFLNGKRAGEKLTNPLTPKMTGQKIGTVAETGKRYFTLKREKGAEPRNGDGLGFFDANGEFRGFRLNKTEGNRLYPLNPEELTLRKGTTIYRNSDKAWNDMILKDKTVRHLPIDMRLRGDIPKKRIFLEINDKHGHRVTVSATPEEISDAKTNQEGYRRNLFGKLGDTICILDRYTDEIPGYFIPVSALATLRRKATDMLERCRRICRPLDLRIKENPDAVREALKTTGAIRNIANSKAEVLVRDYGATEILKALEVSPESRHLPVMECKYCLKRELGGCPREKSNPRNIEGPLYLDSGHGVRYRADFDCKNCVMSLWDK